MNRFLPALVISLVSVAAVSSAHAAPARVSLLIKPYASSCLSISLPKTVEVGQNIDVKVRMMNTGAKTWTKNQYALGVYSDWSSKMVKVSKNTQLGSVATFTTSMKASNTPGKYTIETRMSNGGNSFGAVCSGTVNVKKAATSNSSSSRSSVRSNSSSVQSSSQQSSAQTSSLQQTSSVQSSSQQSSTQTSSVVSSAASAANLEIGMIDGTGFYKTAVKNEKNVTIFRFPLRAMTADIALSRATFIATSGSLSNATNYKLWVDANRDGIGDTIIAATTTIQGNKLTFNIANEYVIPEFKELKHLTVLEIHADIAASLVNDRIALELGAAADFDAENLKNGSDALVNTALKAAYPVMIANQGDLFITKSGAIQSLNLKPGVLAESVLSLTLKAVNEPADVYFLPITTTHSQSIDRLELFDVGATTPFAVATLSCGQAQVPANTFCVSMHERQLVVQEGVDRTIVIRPRMKTVATGLVNGAKVIFGIHTGVLARGTASSNDILQNDADTKAEGEIFIGTSTAAVNTQIQSAEHTVGAVLGNLYITQASVLAHHQLLGGMLGESILSLKLRAENEAVDVRFLNFVSTHSQSMDRLELYLEGATTPFAIATTGGCGTEPVPVHTFCVTMTSQQLVIAAGSERTIAVRPRMKADTTGATSGAKITISLGSYAYARGVTSGADLQQNDGDNVAEGEVFIGTATPAANSSITGVENTVVFSKITSIVNAGPTNGTLQAGIQEVGRFTFTAAQNNNTLNGVNRSTINDIIFWVMNANTYVSAHNLKVYNAADPSVKASCHIINFNGTPMMTTPTTSFNGAGGVRCSNLRTSGINTTMESGGQVTLVLEADILSTNAGDLFSGTPKIQTILRRFNNPTYRDELSMNGKQIEWIDEDTNQTTHRWVEFGDASNPAFQIGSTIYE